MGQNAGPPRAEIRPVAARSRSASLGRTWALILPALLAGALSCSRLRQSSLTVLLSEDILSVDPNRQSEFVTDSVLANVFQPLVKLDPNLKVQTALAESWEHPTPERWRFHLRKNVRFHDGTLLTATVARDQLLAIQHNPDLEAANFLRQVNRIEAVGDDALDLVTSEPRALIPNLLFVFFAKANAPGAFPPLLGTGPFRLAEWTPGERIVLERFDGYWGTPASARRVTLHPIPDAGERLARLGRGAADIAYAIPPALAVQPFPKGTHLVRGPDLTVYYLALNVSDIPGNPFRDVRVRRAFHLAIDRQGLVTRALHGVGVVATQPVSPLVFGYNARIPPAPHDPVEARKLLAAAGYASGLRVRLDVPLPRMETARLVQTFLREVGVDVVLNPLPRKEVYELSAAGKSDFYFAGWDCTSGEASEFYEFNLHSRSRLYGLGNHGGYENPRLDRLAQDNSATLDPNKRRGLLEEAASIVMEELPVLPLYMEDSLFGVRDGIEFTTPADGEIRLAEIGRKAR